MKNIFITATSLAVLLASPLSSVAETDHYTQTKKSKGITNSISLDDVDYTDGNYNDGSKELYLGVKGGDLKLENTPSYLLNQNYSDETKVHYDVIFNSDNFKVVDERFTGKGWTLTLTADKLSIAYPSSYTGDLFEAKAGHILLTGGVSLSNPDFNAIVETEAQEGIALPPATYDYTNMQILDAKTVTLAQAYKGEGLGEWGLDLSKLKVKVNLDNTLKQDKEVFPNSPTPYKTKLTWSLVSGPGN